MVSNHAESTFALLRYFLGGNRPSQTNPQALFPAWLHRIGVRILINKEWYFTDDSTTTETIVSKSPTYATH